MPSPFLLCNNIIKTCIPVWYHCTFSLILFIFLNLFLAVLGLPCCLGFSLVAGAGLEALWLVEQVRRFLIVMALATEPGH